MVDLPKLDFVGFSSVLAGFVFLITGILLLINTSATTHNPVNPSMLSILGSASSLFGIILLLARDE